MKQDLIINDTVLILLTWQGKHLIDTQSFDSLEQIAPKNIKMNIYVNVSKQRFFQGELPQCWAWDRPHILMNKLIFLSKSEEGVGGKVFKPHHFHGVYVESFERVEEILKHLMKGGQLIQGIYSLPLEIPQVLSKIKTSKSYLLIYKSEPQLYKMMHIADQCVIYMRTLKRDKDFSVDIFKEEIKAVLNFLKRNCSIEEVLDIFFFRDQTFETPEWQSFLKKEFFYQIPNPFYEHFETYCMRVFKQHHFAKTSIRSKRLSSFKGRQLLVNVKMGLGAFGIGFFLIFSCLKGFEVFSLRQKLSQDFGMPTLGEESSLRAAGPMRAFLKIYHKQQNVFSFLHTISLKKKRTLIVERVSWKQSFLLSEGENAGQLTLYFKAHSSQVQNFMSSLEKYFFCEVETVDKTLQWQEGGTEKPSLQDYTLILKERFSVYENHND